MEEAAGEIRVRRNHEQVSGPVRVDVTDPLSQARDKPGDCLVPTGQMESDDSDWVQIKHLPGTHIVVEISNDEEGKVSFLRSAAYDIWCEPGRIKRVFYRDIVQSEELRTGIEWAILIRDVLASSLPFFILTNTAYDEKQLDNLALRFFLQCCTLIGLVLLGDSGSPSALELIERDQASWKQYFRNLGGKMVARLPKNAEAEMHDISTLRRLLEFVDGPRDYSQHRFVASYSANENLARFGSLLGLTMSSSFGTFNVQRTREAFLRANVLEDEKLDIMELSNDICNSIPIGYPNALYDTIPAELLNDIKYATVEEFMILWDTTYIEFPNLKRPENDLLLLLCCSNNIGQADEALRAWAASRDGQDTYRQILESLLEHQTPDQIILNIFALYSYKKSLLYLIDELSEPISGFDLSDLDRLLRGQRLFNERELLERMVVSILRVLGPSHARSSLARHLFDSLPEKVPGPQHCAVKLTDQYWVCRLALGMGHGAALVKIWSRYEEEVQWLSRCSGGFQKMCEIPLAHKPWNRCCDAMPVMEQPGPWNEMNNKLGIHTDGPTWDGKLVETASIESRIEFLREGLGYDITMPMADGAWETAAEAECRYLNNAASEILSGGSARLRQSYRQSYPNEPVIETAIFVHDMMERETIRIGFSQILVFVVLRGVEDHDNLVVRSLLELDAAAVSCMVQKWLRETSWMPGEKPKNMHRLSLFRRLLVVTGGPKDVLQLDALDPNWTLTDNLRLLGSLFDVEGPNVLGPFDVTKMCKALSRSTVFKNRHITEEYVVDLAKRMNGRLHSASCKGLLISLDYDNASQKGLESLSGTEWDDSEAIKEAIKAAMCVTAHRGWYCSISRSPADPHPSYEQTEIWYEAVSKGAEVPNGDDPITWALHPAEPWAAPRC